MNVFWITGAVSCKLVQVHGAVFTLQKFKIVLFYMLKIEQWHPAVWFADCNQLSTSHLTDVVIQWLLKCLNCSLLCSQTHGDATWQAPWKRTCFLCR